MRARRCSVCEFDAGAPPERHRGGARRHEDAVDPVCPAYDLMAILGSFQRLLDVPVPPRASQRRRRHCVDVNVRWHLRGLPCRRIRPYRASVDISSSLERPLRPLLTSAHKFNLRTQRVATNANRSADCPRVDVGSGSRIHPGAPLFYSSELRSGSRSSSRGEAAPPPTLRAVGA